MTVPPARSAVYKSPFASPTCSPYFAKSPGKPPASLPKPPSSPLGANFFLPVTLVSCNSRFMLQVVKTVERRTVLLDKIVDVLLAEGISDLSLRPLAKSVGSSARLLIYHFGSKEKLLTDALEQVRQRIESSLRRLAEKQEPGGTPSLPEFLLLFWRWAMHKPNQRYFRLLFEIDGLALQNRARFPARFWGAGFARWRRVFETEFGQPSDKNGAATSTFQLVALNGLLHDFLFTGDRKRTTAALHRLVETISVSPAAPAKHIKASA